MILYYSVPYLLLAKQMTNSCEEVQSLELSSLSFLLVVSNAAVDTVVSHTAECNSLAGFDLTVQ